jgi:cytochrome d ubiquinol oxidase subunit II
MIDLLPIWTIILGLAVFLYVLLDGFDLGIGILSHFATEQSWRSSMMDSIAPIWDGNETWLVFGSLGLLTAFPLAFAIIIPAVYFPVLIMLLALAFRGVAFEFRYRDAPRRSAWDHAFAWGSTLATFAQGIVLGAFIQGFAVEGRAFAGRAFDCFTPFSLFTGLALLAGYALLGAGWLVLKTEGDLHRWARRAGRICLAATLAAILAVSLWTPLVDAAIAARWFSWPNILLFLLSYLGIAISLWPMIVPHAFTLWQAASAPRTQAFLLLGTLFLLPVILLYFAWSYWVFRGKLRGDVGYH